MNPLKSGSKPKTKKTLNSDRQANFSRTRKKRLSINGSDNNSFDYFSFTPDNDDDENVGPLNIKPSKSLSNELYNLYVELSHDLDLSVIDENELVFVMRSNYRLSTNFLNIVHKHIKQNRGVIKGDVLNIMWHPIILEYFWLRGISDPQKMHAMIEHKPFYNTDPYQLKDMEKSVARVWNAIFNGESILIYGDYDTDGVSSVATLYTALYDIVQIFNKGCKLTRYAPDREVYGIKPHKLQALIDKHGHFDVVITVDNGIKEVAAATYAKEMNTDLIVTDHHNVDYTTFPHDAFSVVNPRQDDCSYPDINLAGVGVAYKFVQGLIKYGYENSLYNGYDFNVDVNSLLDFVAIGTVGDMMPLDSSENRYFVYEGLNRIRNNPRPCFLAIEDQYFKVADIDATDIGFNISPKINSSGRLDDPEYALKWLTSTTMSDAAIWGNKLTDMNNERKMLTREFDAIAVNKIREDGNGEDSFIVLKLDGCPGGIQGLIASTVVGTFKRPAVVLTRKDKGNLTSESLWSGSCRSIPGVNVVQILDSCRDLFVSYGGHAAAAGLSIRDKDIDDFVRRSNEFAVNVISSDNLPETYYDFDIQIPDILTYKILDELKPFSGEDFGKPVYRMRNLIVHNAERWGKVNLDGQPSHMRVTCSDHRGNYLTCISYFWDSDLIDEHNFPDTITFYGEIQYNSYRKPYIMLIRDFEIE